MSTERRRGLLFAVLLGVALLGAGAVTTSVLAQDHAWRLGLQVAGLATCAAAIGVGVLVIRRCSPDDDLWWLDPDG